LILRRSLKYGGFNKHKCSESFLFLVGRDREFNCFILFRNICPSFRYWVNFISTNAFIIFRNLLFKTMRQKIHQFHTKDKSRFLADVFTTILLMNSVFLWTFKISMMFPFSFCKWKATKLFLLSQFFFIFVTIYLRQIIMLNGNGHTLEISPNWLANPRWKHNKNLINRFIICVQWSLKIILVNSRTLSSTIARNSNISLTISILSLNLTIIRLLTSNIGC